MEGMGGGDKLTLTLAEHLAKSHTVFLFTIKPLDLSYCEAYFDLELSKIKVVVLNQPERIFTSVAGVRRLYYHRMYMVHYRQIRKFDLDLF